jgi:hypothetical protein
MALKRKIRDCPPARKATKLPGLGVNSARGAAEIKFFIVLKKFGEKIG